MGENKEIKVEELVNEVVEKVNVEEKNMEELVNNISFEELQNFQNMDPKKMKEEMLKMHQQQKEEKERLHRI